jgi:hypothetical protein
VQTPSETSSLPQYNNEYFMKKQQAILCLTEEFERTLKYSDFFFRLFVGVRSTFYAIFGEAGGEKKFDNFLLFRS